MTRTPIAQLKGPRGFTGAQGLPGVNAVANDTATAGYIDTTGTSDTKTALTLFDPKGPLLRKWNAALATTDKYRANIMVLGDSISEGQGASAYYDGYVHVLTRYLQSVYGRGGRGQGFIPAVRGFTASGAMADQWDWDGSPTIVRGEGNISGLGRRAVVLPQSSSASHTFYGDKFRLMFTGWTTAPDAKVTIDDGDPILVPTASTADVVSGIAWTSPGMARGLHTVKVEANGPTITLDGGCFWDGDSESGVTLWDASHAGFRTDDFDGHDASSLRWTGGLASANPDLVIIALGTNDCKQPVSDTYSPEIYGQRLGAIVDLIRETVDPSFAFLLQPTPGTGVTEAYWLEHREAAIAMAATKGCALIDLKARVPGGPSTGSNLLYYNPDHPNTQGYRAYAHAIADHMGITPNTTPAPASLYNNTDTITVTNTSASAYDGPDISCTIEVPDSGRVLVTLTARVSNSVEADGTFIGYTASGANTVAASSTKAILKYGASPETVTLPILVGYLTPGVTTFSAAAWTVSGNTGTLTCVSIIAEPR